MSIKIIKNFFNDNDYKFIKNYFLNNGNWRYNNIVIKSKIDSTNYYDSQFVMPLYYHEKNNFKILEEHKDFFYKFINLDDFNKLNISQLIRVKVNIKHFTEKIYKFDYHTDININKNNLELYDQNNFNKFKTLIIYFNDCNGYTFFKDNEQIIYSEENKAVLFDANMEHSGTTTNNSKFRLVLNINYIEK